MFPLLCLTILASLTHTIHSWDVAVTVDKNIEFYRENGSRIGIVGQQFNELTAITFDSVHETLYFCDNNHKDATIFRFKSDTAGSFQPLVDKKFSANVQGIAFDPVSDILFWTDGKRKSINWMSLAPGSDTELSSRVLVNLTSSESPKAIAVDSCRGYVYWSNINLNNPTIERMTIYGEDRSVIVKNDLFTPISITIDQQSKKLFWIDDKEGANYKIECSNLDGSDRKTVYHGMHHQPFSLVVNKGVLYWTDWLHSSIWKMPLDSENKLFPISLKNFTLGTPNGIVARINLLEQTKNFPECEGLKNIILNATSTRLQTWAQEDKGLFSHIPTSVNIATYCLNGGRQKWKLDSLTDTKVCDCIRGYIGNRCEISLCHNFCLNGNCLLNDQGYPQCRCDKGFHGERCTESFCKGFCLNNGSCEVINSQAKCNCSSGWKGSRCDEKDVPIPDYKCKENNLSTNIIEEKITNSVVELQNLSSDFEEKNSSNSFSLQSSDISRLNLFDDTNKCLNRDIGLPIVTFLSCLCLVLCITVIILTKKIVDLKKRPRIKKRIIVNKNVTPLTYRPNPQQQCEITIENCCNMNVCETPCFEPNNIRAQIADMNRKEEKKQLLLNRDIHDDTY